MKNIYATDRLLGEYLLFHYGDPAEILPWESGPRAALGFPVRAVTETFERFAPGGRALELGCAVGRSSFELARHCREVVGIDFSRPFIEAARQLQFEGTLDYDRIDEGKLTTRLTARVPTDIDRARVRFETGDAMALRAGLGEFDAVLAANLLCRVSEPRRCLKQFATLVRAGGQLVIATPCTWLEEFTSPKNWLGGMESAGVRVTTLDGLRGALEPAFELRNVVELPFLIREHARKFQWSVSQASVWRRVNPKPIFTPPTVFQSGLASGFPFRSL
jgi:putative 4-mercaptohistidine N1-methyltranferase